MPGCIFEYFGRIPASVYAPPDQFDSPLEEAVFDNDVKRFIKLVEVRSETCELLNVRFSDARVTRMRYRC